MEHLNSLECLLSSLEPTELLNSLATRLNNRDTLLSSLEPTERLNSQATRLNNRDTLLNKERTDNPPLEHPTARSPPTAQTP